MRTFSGQKSSQHPDELGPLIALMARRGVTSYLEIGARHGDTFHQVMRSLPPGSKGVAADLPGGAWGKGGTEHYLKKAVRDLNRHGYFTRCVLGDSTDQGIIATIKARAPYDAILIDGDHRFDGVTADWLTYASMAFTLVAFHDIAGDGVIQRTQGYEVEVPKFWRENDFDIGRPFVRHEFIAREAKMGVGVIEFVEGSR